MSGLKPRAGGAARTVKVHRDHSPGWADVLKREHHHKLREKGKKLDDQVFDLKDAEYEAWVLNVLARVRS